VVPSSIPKPERIYSLDYLRGIVALAIVFYHYSFWSHSTINSSPMLTFIGLYGVSIFYLLSGLTLFNVYINGSAEKIHLPVYAIKRIFRIFPLLWLATALTYYILKKPFDLTQFILNISGLFGLVDWSSYIAVGAWSIGNELCFYILFPILIYLIRKNVYYFHIAYSMQFMIYLLFAYVILQNTIPLSEQWRNYTNPLNQVFLFSTGIFIGKHIQRTRFLKIHPAVFLSIFSILLWFALMHGTPIGMVTGSMRILLTVLSTMLVIYFYQLPTIANRYLHVFFKTTGEISYGIYLLHPLVYFKTAGVFFKQSHSWIHMLIAAAITYIVAYILFVTFEKYFIKKGNDLSRSLLKQV
jgi:exopolysaccharide production protein ExoZ